MSGRAAAQLELLGFSTVLHYFNGKADWLARGLAVEPRPPLIERLRVLPFFLNNLAPGLRSAWICLSRRRSVGEAIRDDLPRAGPSDPCPDVIRDGVTAVVLNAGGVLLGAIEHCDPKRRAIDCITPAPQTIRPDMTPRLAAALLQKHRYLLITTGRGEYLGRYAPGD